MEMKKKQTDHFKAHALLAYKCNSFCHYSSYERARYGHKIGLNIEINFQLTQHIHTGSNTLEKEILQNILLSIPLFSIRA